MRRSLSVAVSLNQIPREKWRQRLLEVMLDAESRRNPDGTRDLQYSAALGGLLRNCNTISNSRPYRRRVCGSEAILQVESILNREPDPPDRTSFPIRFSPLRAVGASPTSGQPTTYVNLRR